MRGDVDGLLVELAQVRKSFGDNVVLDGIDLSVERGAAIVIAGPSGSGKSTLLRCINGLEPVNAKGISQEEGRRRARELLERVGIPEKELEYPADLSGGQQQRVAIARALAMEPKLMLFDEPTSALDPEMIREVLDVMRDLARDGMTMLVVTHEMGFAREVCDRLVFIDDGRIVEEAPPDEFFSATRSERAREFVDKIIHH